MQISRENEQKWKIKLENIVNELKKHNPKKIFLFGSRARGDYRKNSDIDIAVDLDLSFRDKRKLKEKIDIISGIYSVDLIFLNNVEENFRNKILKEGKILYDKK